MVRDISFLLRLGWSSVMRPATIRLASLPREVSLRLPHHLISCPEATTLSKHAIPSNLLTYILLSQNRPSLSLIWPSQSATLSPLTINSLALTLSP
jgi:hypothetical protein